MYPTLTKVEYCGGGPLDGDKRVPRSSSEWWSLDGVRVHRYHRSQRGMEYVAEVDAAPPGRPLLLATAGMER